MQDNFKQTVDLREKAEKKRRTEPLEKIYKEGAGEKDLKKISQPEIKELPQGLIKIIVIFLAIIVIGATVYIMFFRSGEKLETGNWYSVKLIDGEVFYGQIADVKADPLVISNAYYNYDQAKAKEGNKTVEETGSLRLVKRGQETHGPSGTMEIVRSQVLFMEQLKQDSKVLKAILDYEK